MTILTIFFLITAILYSSVGFGGASTYLALMLIWGIPFYISPIIALFCNIIVVSGNSINFIRSGNLNKVKYNENWMKKEEMIDQEIKNGSQKGKKFFSRSLNGVNLGDILIMNNWLCYAKLTGDKSYENISKAKLIISKEFSPLSDVRGSKIYRTKIVSNLLDRFWNEYNNKKVTVYDF